MKLKQLGFKKRRIPTNETPLLHEHATFEKDIPALNWQDAARLYDKLSIDGFIKGMQSSGVSF